MGDQFCLTKLFDHHCGEIVECDLLLSLLGQCNLISHQDVIKRMVLIPLPTKPVGTVV